jgi:hypothetical protein
MHNHPTPPMKLRVTHLTLMSPCMSKIPMTNTLNKRLISNKSMHMKSHHIPLMRPSQLITKILTISTQTPIKLNPFMQTPNIKLCQLMKTLNIKPNPSMKTLNIKLSPSMKTLI